MVPIGRKQGLVIGRPAPRCLSHLTEGNREPLVGKTSEGRQGRIG
jgi:hypothetical protein